MNDATLTEQEKGILKSWIGKKFNFFVRDSLAYGETFPCFLGLAIDGRQYRIECLKNVLDDFLGMKEEVTRFSVRDFEGAEFVSAQESAEQLAFSVESKIKAISLINDYVKARDGEEYAYTFGIIIETEDKRWAITKSLYFSIELSINPIESISELESIDELFADWEEGYLAEKTRNIVPIN